LLSAFAITGSAVLPQPTTCVTKYITQMFARLRAYARFIQQSFFMRREFSTAPNRTYKDAIDHLNSLQSNAATIEASRASGGKQALVAIPEMLDYLSRIGYKVSSFLIGVFLNLHKNVFRLRT
jgi:hypothetical protein